MALNRNDPYDNTLNKNYDTMQDDDMACLHDLNGASFVFRKQPPVLFLGTYPNLEGLLIKK